MEKLLISACLAGENCKYSGGNNKLPDDVLIKLRCLYELVPVCPERDGGLPTPRASSERQGDRVVSVNGEDVTAQFRAGAELALQKAQSEGITKALLKERSPSCGSSLIYDGTFSGRTIPGEGVTAELLRANGIKVFSEFDL